MININLSGFEFTTLTGGISYNLWNTKFVHFLLERNLPNEGCLGRPLSISMFFYCVGKEHKEYLHRRYPEIPYLEEIEGWEDRDERKAESGNAKKMVYAVYRVAGICDLPFRLSPEQEAEFYFWQLKEDQAKTDEACRYISGTLGGALSAQDSLALFSLISYMESGKGKLAWQYDGEVRRILQILQVIRLEIKYHMVPFFSGCGSKEELMEKYLVTSFALRRLIFCLSETSVAEAEQFLQSAGLSPFALHVILQDELLPCDLRFYRKLTSLYETIWDEEERLLFIRMAESAGKETAHG